MPKFSPKEINIEEINGGNQYQDGDGVQAKTINDVVEASAWAQKVAKDAKTLSEAASGIGVEQFFSNLIEVIAPLHKMKIFTDNTNPAEIYGGYWLKVQDAFLWCSGSLTSFTYTKNGVSTTEYLTVGSRGGEMSHKLTVNEMPSHRHGMGWPATSGTAEIMPSATSKDKYSTMYTDYTGGGQAHNIMPQYYAVNAWYRVTEDEYNASV